MTNTKEFAITFPSDWTWDIVHELGEHLKIPISDEKFEVAFDEEDASSIKNIVEFQDPVNSKNLMVVCCFDDDIFHHLIVRCSADCSESIKKKLLEVDNKIRKTAMQKAQEDLIDLSDNPENGLSRLEKDYNIQFSV